MNIKDNFLHEFIGTAALLVSVIGSGIMGETLASGNLAVALLANYIATGACLFIIISIFIKSSGAHFNPAVSLFSFLAGEMKGSHCAIYVLSLIHI